MKKGTHFERKFDKKLLFRSQTMILLFLKSELKKNTKISGNEQ